MSEGVGIIRYSSPKQNGGYSVEIQRNAIQECAASFGCDHVEIFYDLATSAKQHGASEWAGMQKLMEFVKTQPVDYFFYYMEDRITRQGDDFFLDVMPQIRRYSPECQLVNASLKSVLDPYSAEGVLKIAQGIDENEKRSRRAVGAQLALLSAGYLPGQRPNYGFKQNRDTKTLEIDESTAPIVIFIFHLAGWGYSFQVIAEVLNEAEIPSPEKKLWCKQSLQKIVRNQAYLGHRSWDFSPLLAVHRETVDKYLAGIDPLSLIPLHVWLRANSLQNNEKARKLDTPFLFRNLLTCSHCKDTRIIAKDYTPKAGNHKNLVYVCPTCRKKAQIETVHNVLLPSIQDEYYPQLFPPGKQVQQVLTDLQKALNRIIHKLVDQCRELENVVESTSNTEPEERALNLLQRRLDQAREAAQHIEAFSNDGYYTMVEQWGNLEFFGLTRMELRRFLIETVRRVSIDLDLKNKPKISYMPAPGIEFEVV